jgi:hypothetical protein
MSEIEKIKNKKLKDKYTKIKSFFKFRGSNCKCDESSKRFNEVFQFFTHNKEIDKEIEMRKRVYIYVYI